MRVAIVSRHKDTISMLKSQFDQVYDQIDVIEHLEDPKQLDGYDLLVGNIPLSMFLKTKTRCLILVSLNIPRELRGRELNHEELRKYAEFVVVYKTEWYPRGRGKGIAKVCMCLVDNLKLAIGGVRLVLEILKL